MRRTLHATLTGTISGAVTVYAMVAAATTYHADPESLRIVIGDEEPPIVELAGPHGTRMHRVSAHPPANWVVPFTLTYDAVVGPAEREPYDTPADAAVYLRPSRYCESDRMGQMARSLFPGLSGAPLVAAVCAWVHDTLRYVPGTTGPSDSALDVLRTGQGVCRDFAHLAIAVLRSLDVPARMVAVWAPGLAPMEFHAVVEACVDRAWIVADPTRMAPRPAMVRIATGRDAADTAFLSCYGGTLALSWLEVAATCDELPADDHLTPLVLG